ncbi:hypothetical protein PIB30_102433, partial [Stylosanthes scabra]|nr:hypothetical protein [Stylosanthes scabra]
HFASMEERGSMSMVEESPMEVEQTPATNDHSPLNFQNIADPLLDDITNSKWKSVWIINDDVMVEGAEAGESREDTKRMGGVYGSVYGMDENAKSLGFDPMKLED